MLREDFLHLAIPSATIALTLTQGTDTGSRSDRAGRRRVSAAGGRRHRRAQGRARDAGGRRSSQVASRGECRGKGRVRLLILIEARPVAAIDGDRRHSSGMAIHIRAVGGTSTTPRAGRCILDILGILADLVLRRGFGQGRRIHVSLLVTTQIHRSI